jgi:predicted kinase
MKYITYTPELESFEAKNFKTDKDYFNLVRNMSSYAYDKDDKKFMKNFAGQFSYKPINTNSVKEFVASLWASKILMKGDLTNRTLSADDKRIPATPKPKSDRKKSSPVKKGVSGVYDPNIFKVVFLAGGPGSGKSAIAKALFGLQGNFSYTGLKSVNSDRFFEYLLKKEGIPSDFRNMPKEQFEKITQGEGSVRDRSKNLNVAQFDSWIKGRLGVIIDGTGDNAKKLINQAKYLKDTYGYEPFMVFVNTTLNKAIERNNKRDRKLPEALVREIWNSAQQALKEYKAYFKSNFVEIDNSRDVSKIEIDRKIQKEVAAFLRKPNTNAKAKQWIESELSKKSKGISGSLYQKFQEVAKKTNFNLRGASLPAFLKWMNANAKELFGKSIATKKWFTLLDEYPQIMDAMASAQIDTEPLEDESEVKVERYYANAKKKSDKIGSVSKKIGSTKLDIKDFIGKSFSIELGSSGTTKVWNEKDFTEQIGRVLLHNFYDSSFAYSEYTDLGSAYRRNVINSSIIPLIKPSKINKTLNDFFAYDYTPYSTREKVLFFKLKSEEKQKWIDNWFKKTKNNPPKVTNMEQLKKDYYNYRVGYAGQKPYTL